MATDTQGWQVYLIHVRAVLVCRDRELGEACLRILSAGQARRVGALLPPEGSAAEPLTLAALEVSHSIA